MNLLKLRLSELFQEEASPTSMQLKH